MSDHLRITYASRLGRIRSTYFSLKEKISISAGHWILHPAWKLIAALPGGRLPMLRGRKRPAAWPGALLEKSYRIFTGCGCGPQKADRTACRRTLFRNKKLHSAGGARGGKARLESNQMPRTALLCKACGPRSGDFPAAEQWESNGIFRKRGPAGVRIGQPLYGDQLNHLW